MRRNSPERNVVTTAGRLPGADRDSCFGRAAIVCIDSNKPAWSWKRECKSLRLRVGRDEIERPELATRGADLPFVLRPVDDSGRIQAAELRSRHQVWIVERDVQRRRHNHSSPEYRYPAQRHDEFAAPVSTHRKQIPARSRTLRRTIGRPFAVTDAGAKFNRSTSVDSRSKVEYVTEPFR